jgi:hypothetical protein
VQSGGTLKNESRAPPPPPHTLAYPECGPSCDGVHAQLMCEFANGEACVKAAAFTTNPNGSSFLQAGAHHDHSTIYQCVCFGLLHTSLLSLH